MSVASWSGSLLAWERELAGLKDRLGPAVRRREGTAALRLGTGAPAAPAGAAVGSLAADRAQPAGCVRPRLLRRLRADGDHARRTGRGRRPALDDRDLLRHRQGGTRPRPLRVGQEDLIARLEPRAASSLAAIAARLDRAGFDRHLAGISAAAKDEPGWPPLAPLHRALGQVLGSRFRGWRVGLLTSEPRLAHATGLPFLPVGAPVPHGGLRISLYRTAPLG